MTSTRWPWTRRERELFRLGTTMRDAFEQLDAERVSHEALAIAVVRARPRAPEKRARAN